MNSLTDLSPRQLRQAADLKERIESLQHDLSQILAAPNRVVETRKTIKISPRGLANIRAGVRKRMAMAKAAKTSVQRPKGKMSAAARARLAAIARARWRKVRAAGKNAL